MPFTLAASRVASGSAIAIASGKRGAQATLGGGNRTTTTAPAVTLGQGALTVALAVLDVTDAAVTSTPTLGLRNTNAAKSNARTGLAAWVPNEVGGTGTEVVFEHALLDTAALTLAVEPGYSIVAPHRGLAASGQAANLRRALRLGADAGSAGVAGQTAALAVAAAGAALAGQAGAFTAAGQQATLGAARRIAADALAVALAGASPGLIHRRLLLAAQSSLTAAGQQAALRRSLRLSAEAGSTTIAGQAAGLVRLAERTLAAKPGALAAAGQPAATVVSRRLVAEAGGLAGSGSPADLRAGRGIRLEGAGC